MWLISFQNRILPKKGYFYESMGHIVKSTQMRHFVAIFTHCALSCCSFLKSHFCSRSKTVKSMQMNYRGMKRCSNSTTSVVGHLKRPQKSKSGLLCWLQRMKNEALLPWLFEEEHDNQNYLMSTSTDLVTLQARKVHRCLWLQTSLSGRLQRNFGV